MDIDFLVVKYPQYMEFPSDIKTRIFKIIEEVIPQFSSEEDKKELFENGYSFIDEDEETELVQQIIDFANTPEIKPIADKNLRFCQPSTFNMPNGVVAVRMSLQGSGGDLIDIFEDFVLYAIRLQSESGYNQEQLQEEWEKFQSDFFQDEVEITFYTQLATCHYNSGGIIEDMISDPNIKVYYLHTDRIQNKIIYYQLKPAGREEFSEASVPLIIEYKKRVNKSDNHEIQFHDAASIFEKVTFIIRIICGGSAHFDFIMPMFLGNLAAHSGLQQNYPSNHLFTNTDATTIGRISPEETWITRLWGGIVNRDIFEWQFVNQKIRDSHSRVIRNDPNYFFDRTYQLTRQLERIVDLIQALENVMGDYGTDNAEYVANVNATSNPQVHADIQTKFTALYSLRNKYIHGRPTGIDSVETIYQTNFQNRIEELENAVHTLDYNLKKIVMVSIMNNDFKDRLLDYHRGLGRTYFDATGRPTRDRRPTAIAFPTFSTIYY